MGCDLCDFLPVVPSDDVQSEVDARGQAASSSNPPVVDESCSAHEMHGRVLLLHVRREQVVRRRGQAVE